MTKVPLTISRSGILQGHKIKMKEADHPNHLVLAFIARFACHDSARGDARGAKETGLK